MEGGQTGGGGGPAPFLLKTYEMVDDSSTDEIVSWSSKNTSFVVWNPPEFARLLLPTYFKHNNFSSFIRQLNTYGFRKIDPERWEFANEEFVKDQKHLLKNIHRRKPIHSHSQPQGSLGDAEKAALDEEIEKLSREKTVLETNIWRFKQQNLGTKIQLEDLGRRVQEMEKRQLRMRSFLEKAVHNPTFVENFVLMLGSSLDISAYNKKRRLPKADHFLEVEENSSADDHSNSSKPGFGHIFHRDFSDKLKLELSPAVSDNNNFVTLSTQSSNEDGGSSQRNISAGDPKDTQHKTGFSFAPETLELSDTGTSFALKIDTSSRQVKENESPSLHCFQHSSTSVDEGDGHISCQLNLTLASSSLQVNKSHYSSRIPRIGQEIVTSTELLRSNFSGKGADVVHIPKDRNIADGDVIVSSSQGGLNNNNQRPVAAPGRVNDVFWEQFLTDSSETEEASSSFRASSYDDQEGRTKGHENSWRNIKCMGLTL